MTIQTAVLQDRLYMEVVSDSERHIYATSSDLTSWTTLTTPPNVTSYGLTTYRSKLVVVGGIIVKCGERYVVVIHQPTLSLTLYTLQW